MFLVADQSTGSFASSAIAAPPGPRNCGHTASPTGAVAAIAAVANATARKRVVTRMVFISARRLRAKKPERQRLCDERQRSHARLSACSLLRPLSRPSYLAADAANTAEGVPRFFGFVTGILATRPFFHTTRNPVVCAARSRAAIAARRNDSAAAFAKGSSNFAFVMGRSEAAGSERQNCRTRSTHPQVRRRNARSFPNRADSAARCLPPAHHAHPAFRARRHALSPTRRMAARETQFVW